MHVLLLSFRKDRVPKIRDCHHGKLSFVALLYGMRSDHETITCMYSLYIVCIESSNEPMYHSFLCVDLYPDSKLICHYNSSIIM